MKIILSRHGNTFAPGDKVVWTGKGNDLPLVEKGIEQAKVLAESLKKNKIHTTAIYCGPLKRTKKYAETVISEMKLKIKPIIDKRLDEIDYGDWTGLTGEEVASKFGEQELDNWNMSSKWPKTGNWGRSEFGVVSDIFSFVKDVTSKHESHSTVLIISSNGRLRYFLKMISNEYAKRIKNQTFKVKTGNICGIEYKSAVFSLKYWNISPLDI